MTDEKTRKRIRDFADRKGLKIPRAYGVLIKKGLKVIEEE